MGCSTRTHNHHSLWTALITRAIYILDRLKYYPIDFCSYIWLPLPADLEPTIQSHTCGIPNKTYYISLAPGRRNLIACISIRLRLPRPYRLHNLHPRQIVQASSCDVLTSHHIPQALSSLQISGGCPSHRRSCRLHSPQSLFQEEVLRGSSENKFDVGPVTSVHKSPLRRPHEQYSRPHLFHFSPVHGPPDDGRSKPPFHHPHSWLPLRLTLSTPNSLALTQRALFCYVLHPSPSCGRHRHPRLLPLWSGRPDLYLLHAEPVLKPTPCDGDSHEEDADNDAQCAMVRTQA